MGYSVNSNMMCLVKADLQTSLDYCIVCNWLAFADKVRIIHDCVINEHAWMPAHSQGIHVMFNY